MGSEQKFLEDNTIIYYHDEDFLSSLHDITSELGGGIAYEMLEKIKEMSYILPVCNNIWEYQAAGFYVEYKSKHTFFELTYIKDEPNSCTLIDVKEVGVDTYLDHILSNTTI